MDRLTALLAVAFLSTSTIAIAQGQQPQPKPPPLEETVVITTDDDIPPFTTTPDEELKRLDDVGDAIAVVEILSLPADLSSLRETVNVRGAIKDGVKTSPRATLWAADGAIEFAFNNDVRKPVAARSYPILKTGERYLIFFNLNPFMTRWYPVLPFRINKDGRLEQVEWVGGASSGWKSPINGMPLSDVVTKLRKQ